MGAFSASRLIALLGIFDGDTMNILQDKVLTGVKIADDKKAMKFLIGDDEVVVKADGDCCSDTWIEHVELPAKGFPAKVISVEDLDMPEPIDHPEHDCLAFYGLKIVTDKGEITIDYRNASNGYYGGNLSWPDDRYFYGGVYGQNVSTENWIDIDA